MTDGKIRDYRAQTIADRVMQKPLGETTTAAVRTLASSLNIVQLRAVCQLIERSFDLMEFAELITGNATRRDENPLRFDASDASFGLYSAIEEAAETARHMHEQLNRFLDATDVRIGKLDPLFADDVELLNS